MPKFVQYLSEQSRADGFWRKFKGLVFNYKALINQAVDIWFYIKTLALPCFEMKPGQIASEHVSLFETDLSNAISCLPRLFCSWPFHTIWQALCNSDPEKSLTTKASFPRLWKLLPCMRCCMFYRHGFAAFPHSVDGVSYGMSRTVNIELFLRTLSAALFLMLTCFLNIQWALLLLTE